MRTRVGAPCSSETTDFSASGGELVWKFSKVSRALFHVDEEEFTKQLLRLDRTEALRTRMMEELDMVQKPKRGGTSTVGDKLSVGGALGDDFVATGKRIKVRLGVDGPPLKRKKSRSNKVQAGRDSTRDEPGQP